MSKDINEYLKYYIGQQCMMTQSSYHAVHELHLSVKAPFILTGKLCQYFSELQTKAVVKPILRKLEDMTEEELIGLLQSMVPADMEDKPDEEDYDLELFHNDGGNLVDGDVAVGANYSCSCYEGQIAIRYDGSIDLFDEDGSRQGMSQSPLAFHYLLSKGFDLFGLIPAGLAIDSATLTNK